MCLTFTKNWFSEQTVNFENIEVYEQLGKLDLNFLYSKDIICTTSVNERHYRYFSKLRGLFFLFWIISFDNCSIEILLLRQIIKFENTVDSLYLEHPLSRTKVSVPLCRLQPIFLSLSRTLSISNKFCSPLRVRDRESQLYVKIYNIRKVTAFAVLIYYVFILFPTRKGHSVKDCQHLY